MSGSPTQQYTSLTSPTVVVHTLTLLISTLPNSSPTILNKLIHLELLHSHLCPFPLDRGTTQAPRQSIGTTPISRLKFNSLTVQLAHLNKLPSKSPLYEANEFQILEPLLVAMVSDLGNNFCSFSLCSFHFIYVST